MIEFKRKNKAPLQVTEEELITNMVDYLREHFPAEECIVYEKAVNGRTTSEGAAAVFTLLKNPQVINYYNKLIKR